MSLRPVEDRGGAVKKYVTFKISDKKESEVLQRLLLDRFPEIKLCEQGDFSYKSLENILNQIKEMALFETSCSGACES